MLFILPASLLARPDRLKKILSSGELRVCIWTDYYGISYKNPKSQKISGIDSDMAQELAKELNVKLLFVESSFAKLIEDVTKDRCDVAMFAIGITPVRAQKLRFTTPHLVSDIYGITTKSNRRIKTWDDIDKKGVVVVVARGTYHEFVMKEKLKQATLIVKETPHAREQEVESGRADIFMTDFPYSRRMLDNVDWARVVAPPQAFHLTYYAYALLPGDDPWYQRLEQFVVSIKKDGRLARAARKYNLQSILVHQ